jgi:crotonobetainyl-CoA:carnitine CoA-transferase CaiB-like acyl-CoA transferase
MISALQNIRVLDLSRVLAGPVCTQLLGDLGADIIKIEKPGAGDDTRFWGPPFLKDKNDQDTTESTYYLSANRNKKSVAIDIAQAEGQKLIFKLLESCDVLIENFKVGGLKKYGLSYEDLKQKFPRLIYASITGFGQTGPLSSEPGYDFIAQGMGGFMASTGPAGSPPTKAGVAISDYVTGLYATVGILAALRARDLTGVGQHVDCALLDTTIAMMTNVAQYQLTAGHPPAKVGNAHSTIVPYQDFETADGHVIIAVGNDHQFSVFARALGHGEWADDKRFATNTARVAHREVLTTMIRQVLKTKPAATWIELLRDADVPVGPILSMEQVFDEPQVQARHMKINMDHTLSPQPVNLVGSALKMSGTPVSYRLPPPTLGTHTDEILKEIVQLSDKEITILRKSGVIG